MCTESKEKIASCYPNVEFLLALNGVNAFEMVETVLVCVCLCSSVRDRYVRTIENGQLFGCVYVRVTFTIHCIRLLIPRIFCALNGERMCPFLLLFHFGEWLSFFPPRSVGVKSIFHWAVNIFFIIQVSCSTNTFKT